MQNLMKKKIFLGIDPGTKISGYGVIEVNDKGYKAIDFGSIRPPARYKLSDRYLIIFEGIALKGTNILFSEEKSLSKTPFPE